MIIPIILCGGAGTRLWPLSRADNPKPFLPLLGSGTTLFQQTLQRAALFAPPLVMCHASHLPLVQEQSQEMSIAPRAIILEPHSQGTAAALATACLSLKSTFEDASLLVLPADLVIDDNVAFKTAVDIALPYAEQSNAVTFGIKPSRAEPRFGYIETADALQENVFEMKCFAEKPSLETAEKWMGEEKYFWNSGIVMLPLEKALAELTTSQNRLTQACLEALQNSQNTNGIISLEEKSYSQTPRLSLENAVMEQTNGGIMVQANFDWNDAGTWQSLWELQAQNSASNVCHGKVRMQNSNGCYVHATSKRVSVLDGEDLIIVESEDEILVTTRQAANRIGIFAKEEM